MHFRLQPGEVNGSMLISLLHLPTAGRLTIVALKCKDLRVHDDMDAGKVLSRYGEENSSTSFFP